MHDAAIVKLIRSYLSAGVMIGGLVSASREGVPQGGPLSPLLSNLMLDVLDRELERRGHSFVRYADDCNIYVASRRAGERVMASVTEFLAAKLKLRVNPTKSAVDHIHKRPFLGFILSRDGDKVRVTHKSLVRLRERIRELTSKTGGRNLEDVIENLSAYLRGWYGYFRLAQTPTVFERTDTWTRRRLRCLAWKQWKNSATALRHVAKTRRFRIDSGSDHYRSTPLRYVAPLDDTGAVVGTPSRLPALPRPILIIRNNGVIHILQTNRRMRTRMSGGVGGGAP